MITLIPGFGEEFGWRGYMLPHLARRHSPRKALLIHAFIWWAWHLPAWVGMGARVQGADANVGLAPHSVRCTYRELLLLRTVARWRLRSIIRMRAV